MFFRKAVIEDLEAIVEMLADDELGQKRENFKIPLPEVYKNAFDKINNDESQELMVVVDKSNEVVGTMQISFIQYLTYQGGIRAQVEAVRIRKDQRGGGIGRAMIKWAIERAKENRAHVIQLTTDKKRPEAIEFYQKLGFKDSHEGMKMHL